MKNKTRIITAILTVLLLAVVVYATGETLVMTPESVNVCPTESKTFTVILKDGSGNPIPGEQIDFESSNTAIATVDTPKTTNNNGKATTLVHGISQGEATITATWHGHSDVYDTSIARVGSTGGGTCGG
ncbi:Ig-like domain-containing protein [Candidatus Woesearchaeota archaeon]|nr:Ig-like domain-containing protein [Candidatus Woesearchaeota archaeon]